MFNIQSTRAVTWPGFSLRKGENKFMSRAVVPAELWPKLDRFRELKLLDFEGEAKPDNEAVKIEDLSQRQLYAMSKGELTKLAKTVGIVGLADGTSKTLLIGELEKRLSPGAIASAPRVEQPGVTVDPTDGDKVVVTNRRGRVSGTSPSEG